MCLCIQYGGDKVMEWSWVEQMEPSKIVDIIRGIGYPYLYSEQLRNTVYNVTLPSVYHTCLQLYTLQACS